MNVPYTPQIDMEYLIHNPFIQITLNLAWLSQMPTSPFEKCRPVFILFLTFEEISNINKLTC